MPDLDPVQQALRLIFESDLSGLTPVAPALAGVQQQAEALTPALTDAANALGLVDQHGAPLVGMLQQTAQAEQQAAQAGTQLVSVSGNVVVAIDQVNIQSAAAVQAHQRHGAAASEAGRGLRELSTVTHELAGEALPGLGTSLSSIGNLLSAAQNGMRAVEDSEKSWTETTAVLGAGLTAAGVVAAGSFFGVFDSGLTQLHNLSVETGLSIQQIAGMRAALESVGAPADTVNRVFFQLQGNLEQYQQQLDAGQLPTGQMAKGLEAIGVSAVGADGKVQSLGALLPDIADGFQQAQAQAQASGETFNATGVAAEIFGRRLGPQLLPFLMQGREGMAQWTDGATQLGIGSEQQVAHLEALHQATATAGLEFQSMALKIGSDVAPAFTKGIQLAGDAAEMYSKLPGPLRDAAVTFPLVAGGALLTTSALSAVSGVVGTVLTSFGALGATLGLTTVAETAAGTAAIADYVPGMIAATVATETFETVASAGLLPALTVLAAVLVAGGVALVSWIGSNDNAGDSARKTKDAIDAESKSVQDHISQLRQSGASDQEIYAGLTGDAANYTDQLQALGTQITTLNQRFGDQAAAQVQAGTGLSGLTKEQVQNNSFLSASYYDVLKGMQAQSPEYQKLEQDYEATAVKLRGVDPLLAQLSQGLAGATQAAQQHQTAIEGLFTKYGIVGTSTLASVASHKALTEILKTESETAGGTVLVHAEYSQAVLEAGASDADWAKTKKDLTEASKTASAEQQQAIQLYIQMVEVIRSLGPAAVQTALDLAAVSAQEHAAGLAAQAHADSLGTIESAYKKTNDSAQEAIVFQNQWSEALQHAGDSANTYKGYQDQLNQLIEQSTGSTKSYYQEQLNLSDAVHSVGSETAQAELTQAQLNNDFGIGKDKTHDLQAEFPALIQSLKDGTTSANDFRDALLGMTTKPTEHELDLKAAVAATEDQLASLNNQLTSSSAEEQHIAALQKVVLQDQITGASASKLQTDQQALATALDSVRDPASRQGVALETLITNLEHQRTVTQGQLSAEEAHRTSLGATTAAYQAHATGSALSMSQLDQAVKAGTSGQVTSLQSVADKAGPAGKAAGDANTAQLAASMNQGLEQLNETMRTMPAQLAAALVDPKKFAESGDKNVGDNGSGLVGGFMIARPRVEAAGVSLADAGATGATQEKTFETAGQTDGAAWARGLVGTISGAMGKVAALVQQHGGVAVTTTGQTSGVVGGFIMPVADWQSLVTQPFGPTTQEGEPIVNGQRFHEGIDLGVPTGTQLVAGGAGIVEAVTNDGKQHLGLSVTIDFPDGTKEQLGHLSDALVTAGQHVTAGQPIGLSGGGADSPTSGYSTGPHTHIQVTDANGNYIDPTSLLGQMLSTPSSGGVMPALVEIGGATPTGGVMPALSEIGGATPSGGVLPAGTPLGLDTNSIPGQIAAWAQQHASEYNANPRDLALMLLTLSNYETDWTNPSTSGAMGPFSFDVPSGTYGQAVGQGMDPKTVAGSLDFFASLGRIAQGYSAFEAAGGGEAGAHQGELSIERPNADVDATRVARGDLAASYQAAVQFLGGANLAGGATSGGGTLFGGAGGLAGLLAGAFGGGASTPGTSAADASGLAGFGTLPTAAPDSAVQAQKDETQGQRDQNDLMSAHITLQKDDLELTKQRGDVTHVVSQGEVDGLHAVTEGYRATAEADKPLVDQRYQEWQAAVAAYDGTTAASSKASQAQIDAAKARYDAALGLYNNDRTNFTEALSVESAAAKLLDEQQKAATAAQLQYSKDKASALYAEKQATDDLSKSALKLAADYAASMLQLGTDSPLAAQPTRVNTSLDAANIALTAWKTAEGNVLDDEQALTGVMTAEDRTRLEDRLKTDQGIADSAHTTYEQNKSTYDQESQDYQTYLGQMVQAHQAAVQTFRDQSNTLAGMDAAGYSAFLNQQLATINVPVLAALRGDEARLASARSLYADLMADSATTSTRLGQDQTALYQATDDLTKASLSASVAADQQRIQSDNQAASAVSANYQQIESDATAAAKIETDAAKNASQAQIDGWKAAEQQASTSIAAEKQAITDATTAANLAIDTTTQKQSLSLAQTALAAGASVSAVQGVLSGLGNVLDDGTQKQVNALQDQLDGINTKADKQQESTLRAAVSAATNESARQSAEQQLTSFLTQEQDKRLQEQIGHLQREAAERKKANDVTATAQKSALDTETRDTKTHYDGLIAQQEQYLKSLEAAGQQHYTKTAADALAAAQQLLRQEGIAVTVAGAVSPVTGGGSLTLPPGAGGPTAGATSGGAAPPSGSGLASGHWQGNTWVPDAGAIDPHSAATATNTEVTATASKQTATNTGTTAVAAQQTASVGGVTLPHIAAASAQTATSIDTKLVPQTDQLLDWTKTNAQLETEIWGALTIGPDAGHVRADLLRSLDTTLHDLAPAATRFFNLFSTPALALGPASGVAAAQTAAALGGGAGGVTNHYTLQPGAVQIAAKDLKELRDISGFFDQIVQVARAKAGA